MPRLAYLLLPWLLCSCVSLNSISQTQIPKNRRDMVSASSERWMLLGITFDTDNADLVHHRLSAKCRQGKVQGILTKDYSTLYFIVVKRTIEAKGYCRRG